MTIQFHDELFLVCLVVFLLVWLLTRARFMRSLFIGSASVVGGLMMPAFIPSHGNVIMVMPAASLFGSSNYVTWGITCFFVIVNYLIFSKLLSGLSRKRSV